MANIEIEAMMEALQKPGYPETLQEKDLDSIYNSIKPKFDEPFKNIIYRVVNKYYGKVVFTNRDLLSKSIQEELNIFSKRVLRVYLFTKCRWKENVPLFNYMVGSANKFFVFQTEKIYNRVSTQRIQANVCPACKVYGVFSVLHESSNKMLYCENCNDFIKNNQTVKENIDMFERLELCKKYETHSKKGYKCDVCKRFIPLSIEEDVCPFPKCKASQVLFVKMSHPTSSIFAPTISIDIALNPGVDIKDYGKDGIGLKKGIGLLLSGNVLKDVKNISPSTIIENRECFENNISKLKQIISSQKKINTKEYGSPNKSLMYDSILEVLDEDPINSFKYLTSKPISTDIPMQSLIFQKFSRKMIELLPMSFTKPNSTTLKITSPTDERLNLFTGIKTFVGIVDDELMIKKSTILTKDRDKCIFSCSSCVSSNVCAFIGLIKNIYDMSGNNIIDDIDYYSFVNIKFKPGTLKKGDKALIEYYSIPPHYSVKSMAHLQRIVKKIHKSVKNNNM